MSIGYKIEIVLISIAILLVGSIFVVSRIDSPKEEPKTIQTIAYEQTTKIPEKTVYTIEYKQTTKVPEKTIHAVEYKQTTKILTKININTANMQELILLDGVGEKIAQRIIEYRESQPFEKIEDIKNVSGIGEKKFAAMKEIITVE